MTTPTTNTTKMWNDKDIEEAIGGIAYYENDALYDGTVAGLMRQVRDDLRQRIKELEAATDGDSVAGLVRELVVLNSDILDISFVHISFGNPYMRRSKNGEWRVWNSEGLCVYHGADEAAAVRAFREVVN